MKHVKIIYWIIMNMLFFHLAHAQTIVLNGKVYKESQNTHDSIRVIFKRVAPSSALNTTYTDSTGYYNLIIEQGIYNIYYSKIGYLTDSVIGKALYSNTTLANDTIKPVGLGGTIKGVLSAGVYKVGANIQIPNGDSLIINPGVILKFEQNVRFDVNGVLIANGTIKDSIIFTTYKNGKKWSGIKFNKTSTSTLSFALIEYSNDIGITCNSVTPNLNNLTIRYNDGNYAGGIFLNNNSGTLNMTIQNVYLQSNSATFGGGINSKGVNLNLFNAIFVNNVAADGGALFLSNIGTPKYLISAITVHDNNALDAIFCDSPTATTLINSIIANNNGYGIYNCNNISNCNFYNNVRGNFDNCGKYIGLNVNTNTNGDSCDAYYNIQMPPLFINPSISDFHIQSISPCIDAGINNSAFGYTDFAGNVRIWDGNNDGDTVIDMGAYEFGAFPLPVGAGTISGATSVCQGQSSVIYTVPAIVNAVSYIWTLPSGATGSSTTNSITVNYDTSFVSGNITVKGHNSYGNGTISTLPIVVNHKPATPIITLNGNVLHSDAANGNQWYNQNGLLNGATKQDYTATFVGDYYVIITINDCSSDPSNSINVALTGIELVEINKSPKVYPNPVYNELIIEIKEETEKTAFEIFNSIGQIVFKGNLADKTVVQTSSFSSGVYLIKLKTGKKFEYIKIMKE